MEKKLSDLDNKETESAGLLRKSSDADLERDAKIMEEMGDVYRERGVLTKMSSDFIKASALYNAALVRTKDTVMTEGIKKQLELNERAICKVLLLSPKKLPLEYSKDIKARLSEIRKTSGKKGKICIDDIMELFRIDDPDEVRIKKEKDFVEKIRALFKDITKEMTEFIKMLFEKTKEVLGPHPQEYSAICLGSLARGEMTPYSDLEWAILIEDDNKDKEYFRNFVNVLHLFVLNIGESPLRGIYIKSLNDYDKKGGDWFCDTITPRGFHFDSAAPWACKTPIGRPDRPTKEGIELIQTPKNMANFCEEKRALKEGYNFARILTTAAKLDGSKNDERLYEEFISERYEVKQNLAVKKKALSEILELMEEFKPHLIEFENPKTHFDVKQDMFRLPTMIINLFKTLCSLKSDNTWDILDEMCSETVGKLSQEGSHNLKVVVSIVSLLRLITYVEKGRQNENICFLTPSPSDLVSNNNLLASFYRDYKILIFRISFTIYPFFESLKQLESLTTASNNVFPKNTCSFYRYSHFYMGVLELRFLSNDEARNHFKRQIKKYSGTGDGNNPDLVNCLLLLGHIEAKTGTYEQAQEYFKQCLCCENVDEPSTHNQIGKTYVSMGKYKLALEHYEKSLNILSKFPDNNDSAIAETLRYIGYAYKETGEFDQSQEYHEKAIELLRNNDSKSITIQSSLADCLNDIGMLYNDTGEFERALKSLLESHGIYRKLHGNSNHTSHAACLANIGNAYVAMGNHELALQYHNDQLVMMRAIHGMINHPDIQLSLMNVALVFSKAGKHELALQYSEKSLEMSRALYGTKSHPSTAHSLSCVGEEYFETGETILAMQYLNESVEMFREIHGHKNHPEVASRLNNIGLVFMAMDKYEQALQHFEDACDVDKAIYGIRNHPSVADTLYNIGLVQCKTGQYESALPNVKEALNMLRNCYGCNVNHPDIAEYLDLLGRVYDKLGESELALNNHKEALTMRKELYDGTDSTNVLESLEEVARLYFQTGEAILGCQYFHEYCITPGSLD